MDTFPVIKSRLANWAIQKRQWTAEDHFVVTGVHPTLSANVKFKSYAFLRTLDGRHALSAYFEGWAVVNVHLESGGRSMDTEARLAQIEQLALWHDRSECQSRNAVVIAGDFNLRLGEDQDMIVEGWRDAGAAEQWSQE